MTTFTDLRAELAGISVRLDDLIKAAVRVGQGLDHRELCQDLENNLREIQRGVEHALRGTTDPVAYVLVELSHSDDEA